MKTMVICLDTFVSSSVTCTYNYYLNFYSLLYFLLLYFVLFLCSLNVSVTLVHHQASSRFKFQNYDIPHLPYEMPAQHNKMQYDRIRMCLLTQKLSGDITKFVLPRLMTRVGGRYLKQKQTRILRVCLLMKIKGISRANAYKKTYYLVYRGEIRDDSE